jgi:integrase
MRLLFGGRVGSLKQRQRSTSFQLVKMLAWTARSLSGTTLISHDRSNRGGQRGGRALRDAGLNIRFHDLRHHCITKLAEGQASEQTLISIAGHLSRKMLEHYSHIRMAAKRAALDAIASPVLDGVWHKTGHSRRASKKIALLTS